MAMAVAGLALEGEVKEGEMKEGEVKVRAAVAMAEETVVATAVMARVEVMDAGVEVRVDGLVGSDRGRRRWRW